MQFNSLSLVLGSNLLKNILDPIYPKKKKNILDFSCIRTNLLKRVFEVSFGF